MAYKNNNGIRYVHQDHLSGTSVTTDSAGNVVATIKYFPFGVCRNSQGTVDTDKLFTGQRLDDTGLYYYNARYYDATIGRFISPDTTVQDMANPQTLNRYSYCLNNPLKYVDPTGHNWLGSAWNNIKQSCSDIYNGAKNFVQSIGTSVTNLWNDVVGLSQSTTNILGDFSDLLEGTQSTQQVVDDLSNQANSAWQNRDTTIQDLSNDAALILTVYTGGAALNNLASNGGASNLASGALREDASIAENFKNLPPIVGHYTDTATGNLIEDTQLGLKGKPLWLTPNIGLSSEAAPRALRLDSPDKGQVLFGVDKSALDINKISAIQRISGSPTKDWEIIYNGVLKSGFWKIR